MKGKIKNKVTQVWSSFSPKESWFKVRTKEKDAFCGNCKTDFRLQDGHIGLAIVENHVNVILCQDCCKHFIQLGAYDRDAHTKELTETKESLIQQIGYHNFTHLFGRKKLTELSIDELKQVLQDKQEDDEKEKSIEEDILNYVDELTEQYLIDQFELVEDKEYLKSHLQIEDYFKEYGREYFDCGQGYCDYTVDLYVKIGNKYYNVTVEAEIGSAKQEYGDRLYWVEGIKSVTYGETTKYPKRLVNPYSYSLSLTDSQKEQLDKYLKENNLI